MELINDFYIGVVEDNIDPNRKGRIKVRIQTLYHDIPVEDIPYAYPFAGIAGKEFQVPAIGKLVNILFLSNDLYSPYYIYSENYNANLQNKLKNLNNEDYTNFSALLFDESSQIYVEKDELTIDQLLNKITINKNSINLELKDKSQGIFLGAKSANQDAVLGTNFFEWMDKFINELMNPISLLDSSGSPVLRPKLTKICQEYKSNRSKFVSDYVKISDNGKIKKLKRYPDVVNNKNDMDLILPFEDSENQKKLNDSIREQNKKSCQQLKKAAPSDRVKLSKESIYSSPKFYNNMMITVQTGIDKSQLLPVWDADSSAKIDTLHSQIKPYAIQFLNRCYAKGIKLVISEAFRTREQQIALQGTGRAAKPGFSYHEYGLAIDVKSVNSNDWDTIGQIGEDLGFRWGRHFRTPRREDWHFDMGFGFTSKELKRRVEKGYLTSGYVDLEGSETSNIQDNEYSGQNYLAATTSSGANITEPCSEMDDLNLKNDNAKKKNTNGQSDENEIAPSKKEEDASKRTMPCSAETILDKILQGEKTTQIGKEEGALSTYDITVDYGQNTPEFVPGTTKLTQPISSLTLSEIKLVQEQMIKNGASSNAVGKYQIVNNTLEVAQKTLKLEDNTIFSPEIQDKLGLFLLERRGYSRWLKGNLSDEDFQNNLAKEWSSVGVAKNTTRKLENGQIVQVSSGESFYNKQVGTSSQEMKDTLIEAKQEKC